MRRRESDSYREARAAKTKRRPEKQLDHIRVHSNPAGDAHVLVHAFDDGTEDYYSFRHPEENDQALAHLVHHMGMEPSGGEESEEV
jgi:hypothetical protein